MATRLAAQQYQFRGGYPFPETIQQAFDDVDLIRAMQMYRVFYPTVSGAAMISGSAKVGVQPNKVFGWMDTQPRHVGYTLNSAPPARPPRRETSGAGQVEWKGWKRK